MSSVGHRRINRHVSPYFTYIKNMNKVIYNVSVLMLLTGHDFLDVGEKMVTTDFFIFLSLKKMSDMESGLSDQVGNFSVFKSFFRIDFSGFLFKFRANYWNFFATRFSLILNLWYFKLAFYRGLLKKDLIFREFSCWKVYFICDIWNICSPMFQLRLCMREQSDLDTSFIGACLLYAIVVFFHSWCYTIWIFGASVLSSLGRWILLGKQFENCR